MHHAYLVEFLQQLNASRLPSTLLCLKVGSPVILLRNLDPGEGLCNGTRMVVLNMRRKVLQYRIISKDRRFKNKVVLIPRIRLSPNAETLPVPLKRLQFTIRLAFAMTINKSQGQSVEHVGINLQTSVFCYGQLYVVFSRCTSPLNISVLLPEQSQESRRTLNVVYKEVFNSFRLQIVYVCDTRLEIDFSYDLRDKEMSKKENPHRLFEEGSMMTFQTTLSAIPQTVVERKHSRLTSTQTS